jgi:ArsR family transcriptional regulator
MGVTKSEIFTKRQNEIAQLHKVLGHPARLAILQFLMRTDQCITGDIVKEVGLAQPTISQHLRELKKTGIITGTIEGTSVCYCIDKKRLQEIRDQIDNFFSL